MTPAAVLVGPRDSWTSRGVLDLLRDWSATAVLTDFVWVDESDLGIDVALPQIPCTVIRAGRAARRLLAEHLADARGLVAVRLVVLGAPGVDDAVVDPRLAARLGDALGQGFAEVVAIHCLIPRHGAGRWRPDVGWSGWHNVVVAPEEAWHPGAFPEVLYDSGDDDEFLAHAAAAVAGVAGLWTGMDEGPFDAQPRPVGGTAVLARTFMRRLDASDVSEALRQRVVDVRAGLPAPRGQSPIEPASAAQAAIAAEAMCAALVAKHGVLFGRDRRTPATERPIRIGPLQALRMLFSFLGSALLGAPRAWADRVVAGVASSLARQVNDAVFGQDSAFTVVVLGRDAQGRLAAIDDIVDGAAAMAEQLRSLNLDVDLTVPSLSAFWRDFVSGGLTLGDGGEHSPDLEPVVLGGSALYLPDAARISPPPSEPFTARGRPAQVVAADPVATHDVLAIRGVRDELQVMVSLDPVAAVEAGAELERLDAWAAPLRASYAGRVGKTISDRVRSSRQDVDQLRTQLAEAGGSETVPVDLLAVQARLARTQRWLVAGLLAGLLGTVLALWQAWVEAAVAIGIGAALLLVWLVAALSTFTRGQAELFRYLHRRREQRDAVDTARYNLVAAVRELHRASVLYRQYVQWAPILGCFLAHPFGTARTRSVEAVALHGRLPRAVWLGRAVPDDDTVEEVTHALGARVFPVGWLGTQWDALLAAAPARLGPPGQSLAHNPRQLYADPADRHDALLVSWRRSLESEGTGEGLGDAVWIRTVDALGQLGPARVNRTLLRQVQVLGRQTGTEVSGVELLEDLTGAVDSGLQQSFDLTVFTPRAQGPGGQGVAHSLVAASGESARALGNGSAGAARVRLLRTRDAGDAMNQFLLLTQVSRGLVTDDLTLEGKAGNDAIQPVDERTPTAFDL